MVADLDAVLQPGEKIVYRTRGQSFASEFTHLGIVIASLYLFTWLNGALRHPDLVISVETSTLISAAVGMAVGIIAALVFKWSQKWIADELIVTDRRMLFANGSWDNKLEAMDLDQIRQVSWVSEFWTRHVSVKGPSGTIRLERLRDADAAARAIAVASGIEAPPALGRLARIYPALFGMLPAVFAVYLSLRVLVGLLNLSPTGSGFDFETTSMTLGVTAIAWIAALVIGGPLGGALTLASLCPFVPAGQMQAAICAGRNDRWDVRLALAWVSLLYGRRLSYRPV